MKCLVHVAMTETKAQTARKVLEKPIGGLLDPRFKYTSAAATNIRATFERVRAEIANKERKL